jgi:hypothetical protein
MVFPPYRKPNDRSLRPGQPEPRREPQVDLAELNEQVRQGPLGGPRQPHPTAPLGATPAATPDAAQAPWASGVLREPRARSSAMAGDDIPTLTQVVQVSPGDPAVRTPDGSDTGREALLQRLLGRSDALLDAQLQQALAPLVERATAALARELHDSMKGIVHEILDRAIKEELARLQAETTENSRFPRRS